MPVSRELLELLRCPETGQKLFLSKADVKEEFLVTEDGLISYPIRNGFPMLVKSEAVRQGTLPLQNNKDAEGNQG